MNIKNGDIITLNNGDVVEVTLKVLPKKIKKLIPGIDNLNHVINER